MVPVSNFCLERWTPPATVERHSRHQIPCTTIFEIDCDDVSLLLPSDHLFPQTIQVWRRKHGTQCGDVIPVRHFGFLLKASYLEITNSHLGPLVHKWRTERNPAW